MISKDWELDGILREPQGKCCGGWSWHHGNPKPAVNPRSRNLQPWLRDVHTHTHTHTQTFQDNIQPQKDRNRNCSIPFGLIRGAVSPVDFSFYYNKSFFLWLKDIVDINLFIKTNFLFFWLHGVSVVVFRVYRWKMWTLSRRLWDLAPWLGVEPGPLHWECGVLATGSPGKSWYFQVFKTNVTYILTFDFI